MCSTRGADSVAGLDGATFCTADSSGDGSLMSSSATSSADRAAAIISSTAFWRWASASIPAAPVPSAIERHLQPLAHHGGPDYRVATERVWQDNGPAVWPYAHQEFLLPSTELKVIAVGEWQVELEPVLLADAIELHRL